MKKAKMSDAGENIISTKPRNLKKREKDIPYMVKQRKLQFFFFKINYLNNILWYIAKSKTPKEVFQNKLINFFKENHESEEKFIYDEGGYQFGGINITQDYIFGKLWKLKKKTDRDFPWNKEAKDYQIINQVDKDYKFLYFLVRFKTNHIIIQDEPPDYTSMTAKRVLESWFDKFHSVKDGITLENLRDKRDFITKLKEAHKIVHAKFTVYPSNFDYDEISRPFDEELKKLRIDKAKQDITGEQGIQLDLSKPNIFASYLVQALRGNGEPPSITTKDKDGNVSIISSKIENIKKETKDADSETVKNNLLRLLELVLKELNKNV